LHHQGNEFLFRRLNPDPVLWVAERFRADHRSAAPRLLSTEIHPGIGFHNAV
jgi:hypothetical protein